MKDKYFVSGCIDVGGEVERVSDDKAQFWTVYENTDQGSVALGDCADKSSANVLALMLNDQYSQCQQFEVDNKKAMAALKESCDLVRRFARKLNGMATENIVMRVAIDRTIGWQESVDAANTESVRALVELKTPFTDVHERQLWVEGINKFIEHCREVSRDPLVHWREQNEHKNMADHAELFVKKNLSGGAQ